MKRPFIAVMIIPTGIGATIGGHAGDATVPAKLLASVCDTLILHPNVVNAADFNEMPDNALYVEGSMLDDFLRGQTYLELTRANKVLVLCNKITHDTMNCIQTAESLLGMHIQVAKLNTPLVMVSKIIDNCASGTIDGIEQLCRQCTSYDFDALAIHTEIQVDEEAALEYIRTLKGVNPWGGVEAILSRQVGYKLNVPVAHAPVETAPAPEEIVPKGIAPELMSVSMLYSVLKGLHKAPRRGSDLGPCSLDVSMVDALVTPDCHGAPHWACEARGIPIIRVVGNRTNQPAAKSTLIKVQNYWEAVGALVAIKEGIK